MRQLLRISAPAIFILVLILYKNFANSKLLNVDNYPIWMIDKAGVQTHQTSGICFLGISKKNGLKQFAVADDDGHIERIELDEKQNPPSINIIPIVFSDTVESFFKQFKKRDFEEITYNKKSERLYITIEGFAQDWKTREFKNYEGVFELTYDKDYYNFDTILTVKKLPIPDTLFTYTQANCSFEGLAVTDNNFFLGLENIQTPVGSFTDSTVIYVLNRKDFTKIHTIRMKPYNIITVCGLYAKDDFNLYGVDRNSKNMFHLTLDSNFIVTDAKIIEMDLPVPGHPDINNITAFPVESITMDDVGRFYCTIDPWEDYYKPDPLDKKRLTFEELTMFQKFVPILFKFQSSF
ncbi:hypothetical protein BH10BAC5_BH10BAC5_24340 [soil metagenome]